MMTLIIGGSGSGKSAYAEDYMISISEDRKKYYIATMQIYDEEGQRKVERHRMLRGGKGFSTIEQPIDIGKAAEKMETGERTALLECISNLTANEMFSGEAPGTEEVITKKIVGGITALNRQLTHLVIVSNNVFEDGNVYDKTTMAYIRAMGRINQKLAEMADEVVEVVVGIPLVVKPKRV
ncbi:bifunctional adenosylcobinamide kinase/adenosylcobinamide-phosphate guanylyltransferase [Lachnospiraceae bacterium MD1]|uniref:Adenosylcobinamide kinase n=1 Tax=Variimorphobacter saccharofermentans TaxID=2755051 RepID=A0A839JXL5_9FIRM|nr:bifunctional adenosylcobinamide kinase/adenosylcobinamide-phosphate guanylyltransferase [Variimorphobacter saccharofermentans]MBB2181722.1 bifunctional adenosylcobinamide kinase/adenosylcobinamide-phosphate guanylyltransferase [Variimorphobacter saccharofermentans]